MGNALSNLGKLDEAIAAFKKQIEITPNYKSTLDKLIRRESE